MMKVLYLLNFAGKAGTERYVETLVRYLSQDGLVQPFFAYNEGGLLVERLEEMGVPCRRVEMRRRFDKKAAKDLAKLCEEWDIDLVHCHYLREHYTALLARSTIRRSGWCTPTTSCWPTTSSPDCPTASWTRSRIR